MTGMAEGAPAPLATGGGKALRHAVILAHPDEGSFTASIARTYADVVRSRGQEVVLRDLYRLHFDPVLKADERLPAAPFTPAPDVAAELAAIEGSDIFVLVYPLWFGTPPAILKGYIERVLGAGFAQPGQYRHGPPHPLLGGKQLLSFSSSGLSEQWLDRQGVAQGLQATFDGYLARAFWMDTPQHLHFGPIAADLDAVSANEHLAAVRRQAETMCDWMSRRSRPDQ